MKKALSIALQLVLLAAFIGAGALLWTHRDKIDEATAAIFGATPEKSTQARPRSRGEEGVPVIVAEVKTGRNDEVISAVGTARALRSVQLHPRTDGVITELPPRAGDRVKKGDIIARLDSAKAELDIQIAQRRLKEASRLLERATFLEKKSVNSNAKVVDAQTIFERAELELLKAEEALRDRVIRAPFAGVVGIPSVEIGERITTSTALISLDQRDDILVEFEVAEEFLARLSVGLSVEGHTPSYPNRTFSGAIEYIDSRVDPVSRTIEVRANIPNRQDELRPGMSFVINIALPGEEYPVVDELSLQWRKGESFVWTVQDGKARRIEVKVISRRNSRILVAGEIEPGQLVVVEGVQRLRPGRPVSFTRSGEAGVPEAREDTAPAPARKS